MNGLDFAGMVNRMIRAAMLDAQLYEEVEHDPSKDQEALMVVLFVALVNGILSLPINLVLGRGLISSVGLLIFSIIWTIVAYYVYAYVAYWVGTNLFKGTADVREVRRVLGYAYTPAIFSWVPCIGWIVGPIWMLVAGVIALRQALDVDTTKAAITMLISVAIIIVVYFILASLLGLGGMGLRMT
ncbi:MAG: YIP1 family protein [Chloroflexi bacterium]|nr:YIP1 family protein [Chloroflexota bacterium]